MILVYLFLPKSSLTCVQALIDEFKHMSYYNINNSKYHVLSMAISSKTILYLKKKNPIHLGLSLYHIFGNSTYFSTKKLYEANYPILLRKITKDLNHISRNQLSCVAFKMQALLKILYVFRTLPIFHFPSLLNATP